MNTVTTIEYSPKQRGVLSLVIVFGNNLPFYLLLFLLIFNLGRIPMNVVVPLLAIGAIISIRNTLAALKEEWLSCSYDVSDEKIVQSWPSGRRVEGKWEDLECVAGTPMRRSTKMSGKILGGLRDSILVPKPIELRFRDGVQIDVSRIGNPHISFHFIVTGIGSVGPEGNLVFKTLESKQLEYLNNNKPSFSWSIWYVLTQLPGISAICTALFIGHSNGYDAMFAIFVLVGVFFSIIPFLVTLAYHVLIETDVYERLRASIVGIQESDTDGQIEGEEAPEDNLVLKSLEPKQLEFLNNNKRSIPWPARYVLTQLPGIIVFGGAVFLSQLGGYDGIVAFLVLLGCFSSIVCFMLTCGCHALAKPNVYKLLRTNFIGIKEDDTTTQSESQKVPDQDEASRSE